MKDKQEYQQVDLFFCYDLFIMRRLLYKQVFFCFFLD